MSYNYQTPDIKETLGRGSTDNVDVFDGTFEYTPVHVWHQSENLCFEPSQIATVINCDKWDNSTVVMCDFVAICDQSQVVTNWLPSQWKRDYVLRRVYTYEINMRSCVYVHFGGYLNGICLYEYVYEFLFPKTKYQRNPPEGLEWQCQHVLRSYGYTLVHFCH